MGSIKSRTLSSEFEKLQGFILILAFIAIFNAADSTQVTSVGRMALFLISTVSVVFCIGLLLANLGLKLIERRLAQLLILYLICYLISIPREGFSIGGVETIAQIVVVSSVVLLTIITTRDVGVSRYFDWAAVIISVYTLGALTHVIVNQKIHLASSLFRNPNSLGQTSYILFAFLLLHKNIRNKISDKVYYAPLSASYILVLLSTNRSSIIALNFMILMYLMWAKYRKKMFWRVFLFATPLLVTSVFIAYTIYAPGAKFLIVIEAEVGEITGKNLEGSRQILWQHTIKKILEKPVLGWGASVIPTDVTSVSGSSHNHYLQTALQTGILGLSSLVAILWYLWSLLCRFGDSSISAVSATFLLSFALQQMFTVTLFQNNFPFAIIAWVVIATGVGAIYHVRERVSNTSSLV